jgi:hypothetical protein
MRRHCYGIARLWCNCQELIHTQTHSWSNCQGLGVLKARLAEYKSNLDTLCTSGFPDITDWTSKVSDAQIGMQLRVVAILLANGVAPKVFQVLI